jgi:hypothetical protein
VDDQKSLLPTPIYAWMCTLSQEKVTLLLWNTFSSGACTCLISLHVYSFNLDNNQMSTIKETTTCTFSSPCGSSTGLLLEGKEIRVFQTIYTSLGGIVHQRVWNSLWYLVVHLTAATWGKNKERVWSIFEVCLWLPYHSFRAGEMINVMAHPAMTSKFRMIAV